MSGRPCSVCAVPALAGFVNASPDLTAASLSRQAGDIGMDLSADRILTHRKHVAAEPPKREKYERKTDFAIKVRDKMYTVVDNLEGEAFTDKSIQPAIANGLKAQAILDSREKVKSKQGNAELAFAILSMLEGRPIPQLEDGNTIEGEYEVVDGEAV
jgi:hypothetical protein